MGAAPWVRRWTPAVAMMAVSVISYLDRNTLAILSPTILKETGLNDQQYGYIVAAFSLAYMAANPLWGRIIDRAGLRRGMTAAVSCWTLASVSHAFATGMMSFAAARAVLGFGEGATFPGGLRTAVQTLPIRLRGRGVAIAYSGGSLGAILAPLIVTPIFKLWGWRGAFWFTGFVGAAWLAMWTLLSRREDIRSMKGATHAIAATPGPNLRDRPLWAFMCCYALCALPFGFVLYYSSLYLHGPMGCTQEFLGRILWIPPMGAEIGYFFWGWLADRHPGSLARLITTCAVLNLAFAAVPLVATTAGVLLLMFLEMFVAAGFIQLSVAYATREYSGDHAGLIAGAGAGSWSAVVAVAMPFFGRLFDQHHYAEAFWIATAMPVAGWAAWLGLRRRA